MTQPPSQPPQGPPQGGFGPPPETSPPVAQGSPYGAPPPLPPAPPTPQPGYGYPQQPGPYAQPGPYGAQPGPYAPAAPGVRGARPRLRLPGQQPRSSPARPVPPPPSSRSPFKGRPALMLGAAVAALLVIGGTVYAVTGGGGDDDKPTAGGSQAGPDLSAPPSGSADAGEGGDGAGGGTAGADPDDLNEGRQAGEAKVLWSKDAPDAPASGADADGMWITDKVAVKAAYKEVFAFGVGNGDTAWGPIVFPQKICAVTPQKSADDKVVVAYMSGASDRAKCNQLQVLDLNTGAKGWSGEVADGALFDSALSVELTLTGTTLMVGRSQSGTAYDLNTGAKLFDKVRYGAACFPAGFAGGARLIVVSSCGASTSTEHDEVQELDPKTGAAKWTRPIPKGWAVGRAYSVDPVVLYLTNKDKKSWNISTLKADGSFRSEVVRRRVLRTRVRLGDPRT